MKKIIGFIVCLVFGLSGVFLILTVIESYKGAKYRLEKKYREITMQQHYDDMIRLVNGRKRKMVKY